ncbi:M20 aminoacylase family protein [uncultured Porphyromonas sp.]|uniref:M20 aminoacylase family protein n=1 Tax=uncultured Porphyromonas sp. TaxID=159274 RepID=UPI0028042F97|nr:M20 aminoacylase family protein [uncultured Porphyromonas sp.]
MKSKISEAICRDMEQWFESFHQAPETAMQEYDTSRIIAERLRDFGYEVTEGIGKLGIVATMQRGEGTRSLGIRAEFDALAIQEENDLPYRSRIPGHAHLCGHDGHTTMLLGAAKQLAESGHFNGKLTLIFQPGEETMQGGAAMVADGLFERFPVDAVYAMHNLPGLPLGTLHFCSGEMMSAVDNWEIKLMGRGSHGSMPELSIDPVVAGASLVLALQSIVSRNVSPWHHSVVTIGAFLAGDTGNTIPDSATLRLSIRNMEPETRVQVLERIRTITQHQAESYGCAYEITEGQPGAVLINSEEETRYAAEVARKTFGEERVIYPSARYMSSEDFAFMLQKQRGCYLMIGNGETPMVHNPKFIFNKQLLPIGASYWVALAEDYLR